MADARNPEESGRAHRVQGLEMLDPGQRDLVAKNPSSSESLASVFRTVRTIQGAYGLLGFGRLETIAQVGQSLLSRLRDGRPSRDAELTNGLLAMVDAVRCMLASVEGVGKVGDHDHAELVVRLNVLQTALEGLREAAAKAAGESAPGTATDVIEIERESER